MQEHNKLTPNQNISHNNSGELNPVPNKLLKRGNNFLLIIIAMVLALLLIFGWFYFTRSSDSNSVLSPLSKGFSSKDSNAAKNLVQNPLTGEMVPENLASAWTNTRPLGAMINNYIDARPHSGLNKADIVYEVVAEGGITRFLAFFLSETPEKIGPIRSTRTYYLVIVKELGDAMLMHIGFSPQALQAIESWPVRSLERGGAIPTRDKARLDAGIAFEHTAYVNGKELRELGDKLGWQGKDESFVSWKFKDDSPISAISNSTGDASILVGVDKPITIDFWYEGDYSAIWTYNQVNNSYLRFTGYDSEGKPSPHIDQESGDQLEFKNVIVQFATESSIEGDEKNRLDYNLVGSGEGLVFMDGTVQRVTWTKNERNSRTLFYDLNGQEIEFNRGKFWVSIVPDANSDQVNY